MWTGQDLGWQLLDLHRLDQADGSTAVPLFHDVLTEAELARVTLAYRQQLAPASLMTEGKLQPLDRGLGPRP